MGHCKETIHKYWAKVEVKSIGGEALARLLIVYPWTQRYFDNFGNLSSADAILHNAKLLAHGAKVVGAIGEGLQHLDNIKAHFAKLSQKHSDEFHVDPTNFHRFMNMLTITLARHFHEEFTPEVQCAFQGAFHSIGDALAKCYH